MSENIPRLPKVIANKLNTFTTRRNTISVYNSSKRLNNKTILNFNSNNAFLWKVSEEQFFSLPKLKRLLKSQIGVEKAFFTVASIFILRDSI